VSRYQIIVKSKTNYRTNLQLIMFGVRRMWQSYLKH